MEPIKFDGANVVYGANQPEYILLPAKKRPNGEVITCWKLSPEELKQIQETGVVWCAVLTFNEPLQPILLATEILDTTPLGDETIRDLSE